MPSVWFQEHLSTPSRTSWRRHCCAALRSSLCLCAFSFPPLAGEEGPLPASQSLRPMRGPLRPGGSQSAADSPLCRNSSTVKEFQREKKKKKLGSRLPPKASEARAKRMTAGCGGTSLNPRTNTRAHTQTRRGEGGYWLRNARTHLVGR